MKNNIYLFLLIIILFSCNTRNVSKLSYSNDSITRYGDSAIITDTIFLDDKSENIKYDMLELNEGELRCFYFLLVNNTEYPISISRITTGDGGLYFKNCQYWNLNSYESSYVSFEFNSENRRGGFNKNLTISYVIVKKDSEPDFYKVVKLIGTIR
jgi:hypothetical protein